jgi:hypothetical protein
LFPKGSKIRWIAPKFFFLSNSFAAGNHLARHFHLLGRLPVPMGTGSAVVEGAKFLAKNERRKSHGSAKNIDCR